MMIRAQYMFSQFWPSPSRFSQLVRSKLHQNPAYLQLL